MIYGSVCSGIEAATVAWEPLGWKAAWFSEIEPFPCALLQHHYPDTPNLGDMTKLQERQEFNDTDIDVLIGGTPCQSFSIAGLRKGMADPRGNLALTFLSIVDRKRPRWVVWENVPGVLSSNGGRDFGAFIGGLAELGYGIAWRILDAQFVGVPQRRRRVFVVGYLGDWRPASAVLFERHSLSGNTPPSRREGKDVAACPEGCTPGSRQRADKSDNLIYQCFENHASDSRIKEMGDIAPQLNAMAGTGGGNLPLVMASVAACLRSGGDGGVPSSRGENLIVMASGQGNSEIRENSSPSLTCNHEAPILMRMREGCDGGGKGPLLSTDASLTLATNNDQTLIFKSSVRRLTPMECERLQGFSDGYTMIPFRAKPSADSHRYKALGNSMAVPVIRWIGERIQAVEDIL